MGRAKIPRLRRVNKLAIGAENLCSKVPERAKGLGKKKGSRVLGEKWIGRKGIQRKRDK